MALDELHDVVMPPPKVAETAADGSNPVGFKTTPPAC